MIKKFVQVISIFSIAFLVIPMINASALTDRTVKNQSELLEALQDSETKTITLSEDIETTQKINITRPVTIDGKGHTIKYIGTFGDSNSSSNTVWGGIYVLQVYKTTATIKDIKLTGGNAALLVNGSNVTLEGKIDVSGNGFGGIELGQGSGVDQANKLSLSDDATLVNTTDSNDKPTLWVPSDSEPATVIMNGITKKIESGDELRLDVIEELFEIDNKEENPKTGDNIVMYILLGLLASASLIKSFYTLAND